MRRAKHAGSHPRASTKLSASSRASCVSSEYCPKLKGPRVSDGGYALANARDTNFAQIVG